MIRLFPLRKSMNPLYYAQKKYSCTQIVIEQQKGMTFDHDFGYSFHLFSSLLKKEGRRKGE